MKPKLFFIYIMLFFLSSCTKLIQLELPKEKNELCVYSIITADSSWRARILTTSATLGSDFYPYIKNANVKIYENTNLITQLQYDSMGYYSSNTNLPQAGKIYTIKVEEKGYTPVMATDTVPLPAVILSDTITGPYDKDGMVFYYYSVNFKINKDTKYLGLSRKIYSEHIYSDSSTWVDNKIDFIEYVNNKDDYILAGYYAVYPTQQWHYDQYYFTAYIYPPYFSGYNYYYEYYNLSNYSETYYKYYKTLNNYTKDDIFIDEKAPVYSNIEGGYGIFAAKNNGSENLIIAKNIN